MKEKLAVWISQKHGIPYRFRKSFIKRACPRILSNYTFEINYHGLRYVGNTRDIEDRNMFLLGGDDKHKIAFLKDYANAAKNDKFTFLDIGAKSGNHSLVVSKIVSTVHAFEPNPKVREALNSKIYLNKLSNITVHPIGLSDRNDRIPFFASEFNGNESGSFRSDHNLQNQYLQDLDVRVGDELMAEHHVSKVDMLKVDVAGVEREVIEGLCKTIKESRPLIILELSKSTRKSFGSKDDFESIFPADYNFYKFSRTSREKSSYKLTEFDYETDTRELDIIALPNEKKVYLNEKISKREK